MSFEINITQEFDGLKPKNFLKKRLNCPYFKIPKHIKNKRITINGKKIKDDTILREEDIIKVWLNELKMPNLKIQKREEKKDEIVPIDLKIPIIYEDENLYVFNKPAGISVQGGMKSEERLINHLRFLKIKNCDNSDFDYFHGHRLDKETSGALVVAKNRIAIRELNKIFKEREVKKKYVCLVVGKPKKNKGKVEILLERTEEGIREKVRIAKTKTKESKNSISLYKVLKTVKYNGEIFSLIEIEIKTGITHQIRVHMKYLGCPIVGDKMYGNSNTNLMFKKVLDRQFLHAKELEFNFLGKKYKFDAPLLKDLKNTLNIIGIKY